MKILNLVACLALFAAATPALAQIRIVTEGTIDLGNLYDGMSNRNPKPSSLGIPASLVHTYLIRLTATLDEGVTAAANRVFVPASSGCGGNENGMQCWDTPAHTDVTVTFRGPGLSEVHELIDGLSGQVIGRSETPIELQLTQTLLQGEAEHLEGQHDMPSYIYERNSPYRGGGEYHLLPNAPDRMHLSGGADDLHDRLEGSKLEVVRLDADHYQLKAIRLEPSKVAPPVRSSNAMLVVKPNAYGIYVRGAGETFDTTYVRTLKSLSQ